MDLDVILKLNLENQKNARTSEQFQKLLLHNQSSSFSQIRVKQDPQSWYSSIAIKIRDGLSQINVPLNAQISTTNCTNFAGTRSLWNLANYYQPTMQPAMFRREEDLESTKSSSDPYLYKVWNRLYVDCLFVDNNTKTDRQS